MRSLEQRSGFDASTETIRALYSQALGLPAARVRWLGAPLTVSEYGELQFRSGIVVAADEIESKLAADPLFVGAFLDHRSNGRLVVQHLPGFKVDVVDVILDRYSSIKDRLEFRSVPNSRAALEKVHSAFSKRAASNADGVVSSAIDVIDNVVEVEFDVAHADRVESVTREYGGLVRSSAGAGITPAAIPGGSAIGSSNSFLGCTVAFSAKSNPLYPPPRRGRLTAAHCFQPMPTMNIWYGGFTALGTLASGDEHESGSTDSAFIQTDVSELTTTNGWVTTTTRAFLSEDKVGVVVCWWGKTTGAQQCGTVRKRNFVWGSLTNVRQYDSVKVQSGDSGGPVYSPYQQPGLAAGEAIGIVLGFNATHSFYTHVKYALDAEGLDIYNGT